MRTINTMPLDDRIRMSVDQVMPGLVSEILTIAQDEAARQVADTEARLEREFEERLAETQRLEREQAAEAQRLAVEAEAARVRADVAHDFDTRLQAAVTAATAQQTADDRAGFDAALQTAVAEAEARATAAAEASIAEARVRERELEMAGMARLVESVRGLDGASSLSEVLDALALAAGRETARAAVLVLKGDHVVGWRLSGFGSRDTQPKSVDMPLHEAGVIGLAATSSRAVTTRDGQADGPGFEHLPPDRMGLAMPVLVGGRVVAVVYADGVGAAVPGHHDHVVPSPWPEVIEVLARHAGRCLEGLTAQKASATASSAMRRSATGVTPGAGGETHAPGAIG